MLAVVGLVFAVALALNVAIAEILPGDDFWPTRLVFAGMGILFAMLGLITATVGTVGAKLTKA